jgi:hypothetical protein
MNRIRFACWALALGCMAPAWAINKCTDAHGRVSFQDAPCVGRGEKIEVRPSIQGATPAPAPGSVTAEGAFGPAWQRKNYLETQGIPQARAAVDRNQRECTATGEVVAQAGPLRRGTLPSGNQFVQDSASKAAQTKAACEARTQVLREQLQALEKELAAL